LGLGIELAKQVRLIALKGNTFKPDLGDWSDYTSRSEGDLALCTHLAFWTKKDPARIDSLFRQSGLMREDKWGRDDYRERTIEKAIALTTEVNEPRADRADIGVGMPPQAQLTTAPAWPVGEPGCFLEVLTDSDADSCGHYEWLIDQHVPKGESIALGGKGGSGKSTLALEYSARILEQDPAAAVVYICAEGTYRDTKIKARKMGLTQYAGFTSSSKPAAARPSS
jgi:hypothetical protein